MIRRPPRSTLFPTRRSSDLDRFPDGLSQVTFPGAGWTEKKRIFTAGKDRKSTRLNSSHLGISYAVFCLKKKNGSMLRLMLPLRAWLKAYLRFKKRVRKSEWT